jgi:hypothetical protein
MSPREQTMSDLIEWLRADGGWNAPYGILDSLSKDRRYRSVTFGKARLIDCEVRIYSPKYITIRTSRHQYADPVKFTSLADLTAYIAEPYNIM